MRVESPEVADAVEARLSPVAARLFARARKELAAGQADAAKQTLTHVLALAPGELAVVQQLGIAAHGCGDFTRAVECFRQIVAARPDDADAAVWLGISLAQSGDEAAATAELRRACALAPTSAAAWYNLGEMLRSHAYSAEAIDALERTLELDPDHAAARLALARTQASVGRVDAAVAGLREIVRRSPRNAEAWFELANLKAIEFDERERAHLENAYADRSRSVADHIWFGFTLARALEHYGEYPRAFDVLHEVNALQRRSVSWDGPGEHARVEAIRRAWSGEVHAQAGSTVGESVVFIACLPRSGSTLVEQILASHPEVEGANEIKDLRHIVNAETARRHSAFPLWVPDVRADDWRRLGDEYLACTSRWRERRPRFTDKSLGNWLMLGAALTMLPGARAVICRRDPLETCLACYRQWFAHSAGFANDLDEMADYCIDFMRLTRFWLLKFPGRVFDLEYEALVAEPEATIRRLLDFCGLPFDPACLEFQHTRRTVMSAPSAAQVRQPLRRDTARADRYGDRLDRLRARLRAAGL